MINRREAFKQIGQGLAAIGGFSLITVPPKKGMSALVTDIDFAAILKAKTRNIGINLLVVNDTYCETGHPVIITAEDGYAFNDIFIPYFSPEQLGDSSRKYNPTYELAYFYNTCPDPANRGWMVVKDDKAKKIGMMYTEIGCEIRCPTITHTHYLKYKFDNNI